MAKGDKIHFMGLWNGYEQMDDHAHRLDAEDQRIEITDQGGIRLAAGCKYGYFGYHTALKVGASMFALAAQHIHDMQPFIFVIRPIGRDMEFGVWEGTEIRIEDNQWSIYSSDGRLIDGPRRCDRFTFEIRPNAEAQKLLDMAAAEKSAVVSAVKLLNGLANDDSTPEAKRQIAESFLNEVHSWYRRR